jgi:hypothetical protein
VREAVHIHAPADAVFALLSSSDATWLSPAFEAFEVVDTQLTFTLVLPLRREQARLERASAEAPWLLEFAADGAASAVTALTWVVNAESASEVHVAAELGYLPAAGPFGWALEETLQRPARQQALRDALWRLKLVAEGKR